MGGGSTALDDSAIPAHTGMEFGQMAGIPRRVFGAGCGQTRSDDLGYWMFSGNYQTWTRIISVGHKGEGWYPIDVFGLPSGLNVKFRVWHEANEYKNHSVVCAVYGRFYRVL